MQLAVTALHEVGGDLSCIGHSKALQSALLAALGRAHSAAYKELHAKVSADRGVAVDLLNASAWSFAYAPVTKVVMPTGLTATEKRTCLRSLRGVTVAIQPLRPIPKTAPAVRAW